MPPRRPDFWKDPAFRGVAVGLAIWLFVLVLPAAAVGLGLLPRLPAIAEAAAAWLAAVLILGFVAFVCLDMFFPRAPVGWMIAVSALAAISLVALAFG